MGSFFKVYDSMDLTEFVVCSWKGIQKDCPKTQICIDFEQSGRYVYNFDRKIKN